MEQSWSSYINSLNQNFLPRKVEVTQGHYFTGSLCNLSFSKGDVITVVGLEPSRLSAELKDGQQALGMLSIPLEYEGKFQLIADPVPFETVADLVRSVRIPRRPITNRGPSHFQNLVPISTEDFPMMLREGETLSLINFEECQGRRLLKCEVVGRKPRLRLLLPMNCRGWFQECQDDQLYSIRTIVNWKLLVGRKRRIRPEARHCLRNLSSLVPNHFSGHLLLHPYFSAMVSLPGENQITMPSNLDIHVTDITGLEYQTTNIMGLDYRPFKIMTIREIYSMAKNKFPLKIKIMSVVLTDNNISTKPLKCGQLLTILRTEEVKKFVATEISQGKKGRCFLIPHTYQGMVLRRGRYFHTVSDVAAAMKDRQLCFQSSRDYTSPVESFTSFTTNECFLALKKTVASAEIQGEMHRVDVLKCLNIVTKAHIKLPLFAEGDFLEMVEDTKPGTLQELCPITRLPCQIRVVSPDTSMTRDPLYGTKELRVENVLIEQCLIAKDEVSPDSSENIYTDLSEDTFEIPIEKLSFEVIVIEERSCISDVRKVNSTVPQNIQEITEEESRTFSNYLIVPCPPPPLPKPRNLP